jgi:hypothetical protein
MAFVFAVSLAQLPVRISALVADRERVAFSGLSALAMANSILLAYLNWLAMYELRDAGTWNLFSISVTFLQNAAFQERLPRLESVLERQTQTTANLPQQ